MRKFDTVIRIIISLLILDLFFFSLIIISKPKGDTEYLINGIIVVLNLIGVLALVTHIYLLKKERKIIGIKINKLTDEGVRIYTRKYEKLMYSRDIADLPRLTRLVFDMNVLAVAQPKNLDELKRVLRLCHEHGIPVIPRASGTSGYGGTLPVKNGIIVNLNYFDKIIKLDEDKMLIEVETNVIWKRLLQFLDSKGYMLQNYPSSSPSSAVGGWVSQGGYGIGSSYYGSINNSVKELKIIGLAGNSHVIKNPECYIGSCGTLGIIWRVILKIEKKYPLKHVALVGINKSMILDSIEEFQKLKPYNLRFIDKQNLKYLISLEKSKRPFLCEITPDNQGILAISFFKEKFDEQLIQGIIKKYSLIKQPEEVEEGFWEDRYSTLKIKRRGPSLIIAEVVVPTKKLSEFYRTLEKGFCENIYVTELISTVDLNSVIMVWFPVDMRKKTLPFIGSISYTIRWMRSFEIIQMARKLKGRPYSTGLWFSAYLKEVMPKECIKEIKQIKKKVDPEGISNPGKVFSLWVPRFFPVLKMSFIIRLLVPVMTLLYRVLPKKYR
ncbi:MAG: FAD-binding oxidoreductase [Candidatus Hodarchaeales archaeon]